MKSITRHSYVAYLVLIPLLLACQKSDEDGTLRSGQVDVGNPVVQAADGTGYSVQCLRSIAGQIKVEGKAAVETCQVNLTVGTGTEQQNSTRGKFFTSNYSWLYYPPTYLNPNSYTYNYPSTYSPYNDTSYSNNDFCSFVFGGSYSYNCYYIFGYTNPSNHYYNTNYYNNYYNSDCSSCLYANNPTRCAKRCYRNHYF